MKRSLAGIIAVAIVQIAFGIYLSVERSENAARLAVSESGPVLDDAGELALAEIPDIEQRTTEGLSDPGSTRTRRNSEDYPGRAEQSSYRRSGEKPRNLGKTQADPIRSPLKVIITDPYAGMPSSEHRLEKQVPVRRFEKPENRTFIAKVMPVVKKPFDWLKAIAAQLK